MNTKVTQQWCRRLPVGIALVVTYLLLTNPRIPAMFMLLIIGVVSAVIMDPQLMSELAKIHIGFKLPVFSLSAMTWNDLVAGTLLLTLPQIPLTFGNAVIAIVAKNNELFPDRKVTEKKIAISQGIMNLVAPIFGGVPMCHGAGGMAGHVRFGAKTGDGGLRWHLLFSFFRAVSVRGLPVPCVRSTTV